MVLKGGKINCLDFNSLMIAVAGTGLEEPGAVTLISFREGSVLRKAVTSAWVTERAATRAPW